MPNLDTPGMAKLVAEKLTLDIDAYAVRTYFEGHRWHLGASFVAHECSRYLWYVFRWCDSTIPEGRVLRLFNRGHREEARYIEYLNGIGAKVWTHDTSQPIKPDGSYPQFRMKEVNGHFGGSLDAAIQLPERYLINEVILGEFKTNGTGKGFTETRDLGMQINKHQHFGQMSCYGKAYGFKWGAYFITNKNDDDLEIQIIKLDWNLAAQLTTKAEKIIRSKEPPPKLSLDPTFWKCVYCNMEPICHKGKKPQINCRSCKNAMPTFDAEWFCNVHNGVIPREIVPQACPQYRPIVNA